MQNLNIFITSTLCSTEIFERLRSFFTKHQEMFLVKNNQVFEDLTPRAPILSYSNVFSISAVYGTLRFILGSFAEYFPFNILP